MSEKLENLLADTSKRTVVTSRFLSDSH